MPVPPRLREEWFDLSTQKEIKGPRVAKLHLSSFPAAKETDWRVHCPDRDSIFAEYSVVGVNWKSRSSVHPFHPMPETRAIRRRHHSAKACCLELPQQSYHQCDQSSIPSCGEGVFSDERPSVKMKLDNIWNNKLQAHRECTSTRDGESKKSDTGTENLKNPDTILNVTSGVLHFVGYSLVPDTINKNCLEGARALQQVDKKFIPIVANRALAIRYTCEL